MFVNIYSLFKLEVLWDKVPVCWKTMLWGNFINPAMKKTIPFSFIPKQTFRGYFQFKFKLNSMAGSEDKYTC